MFGGLLHAHSGLRWLVLIFLIWALARAASGRFGGREWNATDNRISMIAVLVVHLQFVIGLVMYFLSAKSMGAMADFGAAMKDPVSRFWLVEHLTGMLLAVVLITIGRARARRKSSSRGKHNMIFWTFLIGLLIILASIPWPFLEKFKTSGWF